jgi:hypothetical protein
VSDQDAKAPSARDIASFGSEGKGSSGENDSSSSDNSSYFVRNTDPEAVAVELGCEACGRASWRQYCEVSSL